MFLSPSHMSANSEIEDDVEDFYSSSKKIESKRKAQSISQMIRKVEHVIKHSEQKANQICSESKAKHYEDMQFGTYQPQQLIQNIQPHPFTVSNIPLQNPHYSQPSQQKIFQPSPSPRRITCPVENYGSSIKPTQIRMSDYTTVASGEDNSTKISGFSSTLISEAARQPFAPLNITSNQLYKESQYITAQQLKGLLDEQLSLREKSIVSQLSSCLKNMIIPEIKRQVIQDMDKKKSEIETLLKKFQGTVQEEMRSQALDEKIAIWLKKQKIGRNQAEIKTQSLDQKICAIEGRMERLEEHSCGQIEMVEKIKAESRLAVMDLNHSRRQFQKIEETVQALSQNYISLQQSMNKNLEEFSKKVNSLKSTDEISFNQKKDAYQTDLIDNFKQNLQDGDIVLTRDAKETQNQNVDSLQKQRIYEPKNLIQSFSNFDVQPTLSNEDINSLKSPKDIHSYYNPVGQIQDLVQISFRNDSVCQQRIQEELITLIRNSSKQQPPQSDICSAAFITQQHDSQTVIDNDRLQSSDFELSTDINYVRKGLPQLFDYVESTYAEDDENNRNVKNSYQYEDKGQTESLRHSSILIGEEDAENNLNMRIESSIILNSGIIRNTEAQNHEEQNDMHNNSIANIDLEEFILNKINSSKKNSTELSQS